MRSLWIVLSIFGIQIGSCYAIGQNIEGYVQTSENGWFQARKNCIEERNTDMFDPSERRLLEHSHVLDNKYYWVGRFETSQWRWTDNSPLFTNIGLCDVPTDVEDDDKVFLSFNSVLECYRKCKKYTIGLNGSKCYCFDENDQLECSKKSGDITMCFGNTMGLIGSKCYCLDEIDQSACSKESRNIMMCFGNPMDHCGTESTMSVYYVDVPFKIDGHSDYKCAISRIPLSLFSTSIEVHTKDCGERLYSICDYEANKEFDRCQNGLCVSTGRAQWTSSNQSCSLSKFSFLRQNDFTALQRSYFIKWNSYWIGLHKQQSRHWINGKTVQLEFVESDQDIHCLALKKTAGKWSEHWISCNENHQSLCSSEEYSGKEYEIPGTTSPTTEESQVGEEHTLIGNGNGKTVNGKIGIYVGVGVGGLLVLAVIGIIVVLKRKDLFCFKRLEENKNIAMETIAYIFTNNLENQDALYENGQRGFGHLTTNQNRPGEDSSNEVNTYYNMSKAVLVNTDNPNNDFDGARENYDTVHRIDNVDENTYEYIKPHVKT